MPDLDGALDGDTLRNIDKGSGAEARLVESCKLLRSETDLGGHEALLEKPLMLLGRFFERQYEHPGRESRCLGMEETIVSKDQLGREISQPRGAGNESGRILDRRGHGEAREIGRLDVGEAPRLVATTRKRKRLEEIPGLLLILMEALGPVRGRGSEGGDGMGGAHPTDPSISRSMRRFNSTEYSIGNCWTRSLTKPFTARLMAAASLRPRCCM